MKNRIGLASLSRGSDGLTVAVKIYNYEYTVDSVPENIIRCAIGEEDMAYLLGEQESDNPFDEDDRFVQPSSDESQCFQLSPSEFKDCIKYGEIRRDHTGRPEVY